ncbi:MAG TPA: hypothetical protein GX731_04025 [Clostridiales bacterium]|nr:hypothetical protein [Clostridiales bacterium]
MFNKYDEKTKKLFYRYGHQAFLVFIAEMIILTLFYISDASNNILYKYLFITIETGDLLLLTIWLPLGYFIIRSIIGNCVDPKSRILDLVLAPLNTILYIKSPYKSGLSIPFLVVMWGAFIAIVIRMIYDYVKK